MTDEEKKKKLRDYKTAWQWNKRHHGGLQKQLPSKIGFVKFKKRHTGGKKAELASAEEQEKIREYKRVLQWKRRHPNGEPCPPNSRLYIKRTRNNIGDVSNNVIIKSKCPHCEIINPDSYHDCLTTPAIYQGILQND